MNADVDLIGTVIADYSLGRHRGLTDEETQERAERALSWLVEEVESLQAQLAESQRREMEVDDIADFIIQNEDSIRLAMDTQDRRYLENIIISWRCGSEDGE
jgi:hypothetical protein